MFWSKDGSVLIWNKNEKQLFSYKNPQMKPDEIQLTKKLCSFYLNLHSPLHNDEIDGKLILHSCQNYSQELIKDKYGFLIFRLIEACVLTPKTEDTRKTFVSAFLNEEDEASKHNPLLALTHLLICDPSENFVKNYTETHQGSVAAANLLTTLYDISSIEKWKEEIKTFSQSVQANDFDKKFIDFLTSDKIHFSNWMLNACVKVALTQDRVERQNLAKTIKEFLPSLPDHDSSIDSAVESLIYGDIIKFCHIVYIATDSEMIAAYSLDLLFCASDYSSHTTNPLTNDRELALKRYAEFLIPQKKLANEVYALIRYLPNSTKIMEPLLPVVGSKLLSASMTAIGNHNKWTCNFRPRSSIFEDVKRLRSSSQEDLVECIRERFPQLTMDEKRELMPQIADVIKSDAYLPPSVVIEMIDSTEDPELQKSLSSRFFMSIETNSSVPLYQ